MGTASPGRERVDRTRAHPAPLPGTPSVHTMHSHSPAPTHHTTGSVPHTQQNQGSVPQLNSEQLTEEVGEHYSERTEEGKGERFQVGLAPQFNSERLTEEGGELHSERTEEGRGERSRAGSVPQPNPGSVPLQCVQQQQLSHPLNSPILSSPLAPDDTPLLSSATLQKFQQQEHVPPPVQKDFPPAKIRRRDAARPHTAGWYNWECPVCQESIRVKGHNNGNYYKQKHLKTVHQTMSKFPTPRSSTTLRCQLRAKQMQALVQPKDQHELVHIHTVDLHSCMPQGTTWICKQCLAKGSTAKMHQYQRNPDQPPANRAKWWARLTLDQKTLLASKLDMRPDTLAQWEQKLCQKLSQKRKRPPCVGSAKDKADRTRYRQELAAMRTKWRQKYAITTNARAASGAVNGTSVFIPTVPPRLNKIKPATSNPTSTSPPLPASRSSVQRAPTRAATATAKGRGASCRSTASRTTPSKLAKRSKHKTDLTKQGIEPNPGPSRHHRSRHRPPHTGVRLWQCNVRSFHKRSSILQECSHSWHPCRSSPRNPTGRIHCPADRHEQSTLAVFPPSLHASPRP